MTPAIRPRRGRPTCSSRLCIGTWRRSRRSWGMAVRGAGMKHINHSKMAGALVVLAATLLGGPAWAQVDISGSWSARTHEDSWHRGPGPEVADYTGLPINEAARFMANTHDLAIWSQRGYQCRPHNVFYGLRGPAGNIRFSRHIDDANGQLIAYEMIGTFGGSVRRIWMDGRPHPPKFARHTWQGFSTGRWVGDMLVVNTTHIKKSYMQRNGVDMSDQSTITE